MMHKDAVIKGIKETLLKELKQSPSALSRLLVTLMSTVYYEVVINKLEAVENTCINCKYHL